MRFQKISITPPPPPHGRGRVFQGGGGGNLPNFPVGRGGVTIGKYFQRVLMTRKRVSKKKHKNLPWQFAKIQNTTKVKELLNPWINGHNEHILSVPWRDLSHENIHYSLPFFGFGICLNGSGCLFKQNCHSNDLGYPFGLSVWKKLSSVRTAWAIHLKKFVSIRTAWAICLKKNLSTVQATETICSKINFSQVSIPKPFRR